MDGGCRMRRRYHFSRLLKAGLGMVICCLIIAMASFSCQGIMPNLGPKFVAIVLGSQGGISEGNLTSVLLAKKGTTEFIALDAGSLCTGIQEAKLKGSFKDVHLPRDTKLTLEGWVLRNRIKAYLITHAHLDHVSGLVINSSEDSPKPILALDATINNIRDHLFNWKIWPNFGSEGVNPINSYAYVRLTLGSRLPIEGTTFTVEPFLLHHSHRYPSTGFLLESDGFYALFLGDTGPDAIEGGDQLQQVWTRIAPLVKSRKLRGIFMEVAYPVEKPDEQLFGHLTPAWLMKELHVLAGLVDQGNPKRALRSLKVFLYHVKPSLTNEPPPRKVIARQMKELNDLNLHFVFLKQGERIEF
jgi:3',5'-cyclic-nucleotide phosphodiesterase